MFTSTSTSGEPFATGQPYGAGSTIDPVEVGRAVRRDHGSDGQRGAMTSSIDGSDPTAPLWRAAQVFRLISCVYAAGFFIAVRDDLVHPWPASAMFVVLLVWSAACAVAYLRGFGRRLTWVIAEVVIVVLLMGSTELVANEQWVQDNQTWPTTLWATNATISVAILRGPGYGMVTGLLVIAMGAAVKGAVTINLGRSAGLVIELAVALAVGMAAVTARRSFAELQRATRLAATLEERERLSRQVHDGVIQVLAYVAKRGREIGGATTELADLAGEQERALRRLVSSGDVGPSDREPLAVDFRALLLPRESDRVSVSVPGTPVLLADGVASELEAAVVNVLDNVRAHAGSDARAYVLVEDLGDAVTVSIRDDGVGISEGRLAEAEAEGRMGVSKSIVGRLKWLGGTAELSTGTGCGTEWELTVPRTEAEHG